MNESFKMVKYYLICKKAMNRLVIPSILAATVLIAGMFALMPVEKASTVHTTIQNTGKPAAFDTILITEPVVFDADADRFVLLDLHDQVATDGGFVVVRSTGLTAANLRVVAIDATGAILASTTFAALAGAGGVNAPYDQLLHAHIPTDAGTVLIALARTAGNAITLPIDTAITTTIHTTV